MKIGCLYKNINLKYYILIEKKETTFGPKIFDLLLLSKNGLFCSPTWSEEEFNNAFKELI
jgi:hypothetical protein